MPPRKQQQSRSADPVVYAKASSVLAHGGQRHHVRAGEPWDATDPLVKQYPDMFVDHLPAMRSTQDPRGYREHGVERATRAPGERRDAQRVDTAGEDEASGEE